MIKFNPELLTYEEIEGRAVTITGMLLAMVDGEKKTIRIDRSVYQSFKARYTITKFKTYRTMILIKYDGYIVDIETYPTYIPQQLRDSFLAQYRFNSIDNIEKIKKIEEFKEDGRWYIDGRYVFELVKDSSGKAKVAYDKSGKFGICSAKCFKLSDLKSGCFYTEENSLPHTADMLAERAKARAEAWEKMISGSSGAEKGLTVKKTEKRGRKASYSGALGLLIKSYRSVIVYSPRPDLFVFTPTLPNINLQEMRNFGAAGVDEKHYVNLYFLKKASDIIGSEYGHEANRVLNLRQTLADYKIVNFMDLPSKSLKIAPVGITFQVALAWLMRFASTEKDIIKLRKIQDLVSLLTESGLVHKHNVTVVEENKKATSKIKHNFIDVKSLRKQYGQHGGFTEFKTKIVA